MFYDTVYRHNQALSPAGLETVPAALYALNAAVDDCRRAGKPIARDPAIILLIRTLADVAERSAPSVRASLRMRCVVDRAAVLASPALLDIAGNSVSGNYPAKRTFHYQARRALARLAEAIGLDPDTARINSALGADHEDGTTELRHADIGIRVVPRSFLPDSEISFNRCRDGEPAGKVYLAPVAELLDTSAFARRLAATRRHARGSAPRGRRLISLDSRKDAAMGWLFMRDLAGHSTPRAYLDNQFTYTPRRSPPDGTGLLDGRQHLLRRS